MDRAGKHLVMNSVNVARCAQAVGLTLWVRNDQHFAFEAPAPTRTQVAPPREQSTASAPPLTSVHQLANNIKMAAGGLTVDIACNEANQLVIAGGKPISEPWTAAGKRAIWQQLQRLQ